MNRSIFDVVPEFEGRKEFIDSVMAENGKDIEKAKGDLGSANSQLEQAKTDLANANESIKTLKQTIEGLKGSGEEIEALKNQIAQFEAEREAREQAEALAQAELGIKARFDAVVGSSEFVNDFTKQGAYETFKKALEDANNKGLGDKEIFDTISKDQQGWFKSKQNFVNIAGVEQLDTSLINVDNFKKMTLIQQMEFANAHPSEYEALTKMI